MSNFASVETATDQHTLGSRLQTNHEHGAKGLQEASVELNPIRNDAKADTIEMEMNQYGMVVNDFATATAESGSTAPQVVHFTKSLRRTVEAQKLDSLVIKFKDGPTQEKIKSRQDASTRTTSWSELANF